MEVTAWTSLHSAINAQQDRRTLSRAGLRRVAAFARPHRRGLTLFLLLSVVTALLAVATPVLASRVVTAIVDGRDSSAVTRLALLIALIAVAEAGLGLLTRRLSATLGEGLILDLRTAVFDHVQRMPVAFFTRTRTGALVSRLNNDVIGAQRAFSNTLSGVVANTVTLLLTLTVMLSISWQITLLALVLLPVFVLPARRMGTRMAAMQREASALNAAMGTQMTERFSAPARRWSSCSAGPPTSPRSSRPGRHGYATSGSVRRWPSRPSSRPSPWSPRWPWHSCTGSEGSTPCAVPWTPVPSSPSPFS